MKDKNEEEDKDIDVLLGLEVLRRFNEFDERVTKEMPSGLTTDEEWEFMNTVCKETIEQPMETKQPNEERDER